MFVVELACFDLVQIVKIRTVLPDNPMDPANLITSGFEQHTDDEEVEVKNKRSNSHRLFMPCSLEMMGIGVGVGVGDGDGKGTGTGDGNNVLTCRYTIMACHQIVTSACSPSTSYRSSLIFNQLSLSK